jgi:hypothetical protein
MKLCQAPSSTRAVEEAVEGGSHPTLRFHIPVPSRPAVIRLWYIEPTLSREVSCSIEGQSQQIQQQWMCHTTNEAVSFLVCWEGAGRSCNQVQARGRGFIFPLHVVGSFFHYTIKIQYNSKNCFPLFQKCIK